MIANPANPAKLALVVAALAPMAGCATTGNTLSDADRIDGQRNGALAVFVNRKVTDSIHVPDGDATDWKYVDINKNGIMRVAVAFDDPDRVDGEVVLRDNFATVIERQTISGGRNLYAFEAVNAVRGRYYVEIRGEGGASVYTVGVAFEEPNFGVSFIPDKPVDRGDDQGGGRRITSNGSGGGPVVDPRPDEKPEEKPEEKPAEVAQPDTGGQVGVSGSIRRVTPLEDGGAMLTVFVGGANGELVNAGTGGTINGLGASVIVRSRSGNFARAYTKADAEQLGPYKAVTFSVKKP